MGTQNKFSVSKPCCGETPPCIKCTTDSDSVAVTLANITDGECDCSWLNATFILSRESGNVCKWSGKWEQVCYVGYPAVLYLGIEAIAISYKPVGSPGFSGWQVNIYFGRTGWNEVAQFRWLNTDNSPFDCTAVRLATLIAAGTFGSCGPHMWAGVTCQVN